MFIVYFVLTGYKTINRDLVFYTILKFTYFEIVYFKIKGEILHKEISVMKKFL